MITVKGTRTGPRTGGPAADFYRTQEERPAARMVALLGAGIAGAVAYFASGSTAAAAEPPPPPKPRDAAEEEAGPAPSGEAPRAGTSTARPETDADDARAEAPPPAAMEAAGFVDAPAELALAARLARLGPPARATGEDPAAGIMISDDPVGAARIRPLPKARPSATGNDDEEQQPSGEEDEASDDEGAGEDDETPRNRAPRAGDPVSLPAVMATQAVFIPLASLLAGSSDPDGEPLEVRSLTASAGLLLPVEGGWVYLAPPRATEDVALSYVISDGHDGVPQRAVFDVTPEGAVAAGTAAPELFAALPASARQGSAPAGEEALAAPAARHGAERAGPEEETTVSVEAAPESPPADSTAATDAAGSSTASAPTAAPADPVAASTALSGGDGAVSDPAGASLAALPAPAPVVPADQPAAPVSQPAAPASQAAEGTVAASLSDGGGAPATFAATEADSFTFAPDPADARGETVGQIVALEVGDRVDVAATAPTPDPDGQFAAAYGDDAGALPYQIHADAAGPAMAPALPDPIDPGADALSAGSAMPDPLLNA